MKLKTSGSFGISRMTSFAALVALTLVVFAVALRAGVTGPGDTNLLDAFETIYDLDIGPDTAWFASGLSGDGAAFTLIAIDPLGEDIGRKLYITSYRYGRAGYSWLAAAVVGGSDRLILFGLAAVGLVSIAVVGWVSVRLREERGLWAWLLVLNPALYIGFVGNTAEPLGLALLSVALISGSYWAGLALALVRETYLVALAGRWYLFVGAVLMALFFRLFWIWKFDGSLSEGAGNVVAPFQGVMAEGNLLAWLVVLAGLATVIVGIRSRDLSWILSGMLVVCLGPHVTEVPIHAVRAAGILPVLWAFGPAPTGVLRNRRIDADDPRHLDSKRSPSL